MPKEILTQSRLKELLNYNPNTGIFTRTRSTCPRIKVGDIAGSLGGHGYLRVSLLNTRYTLHRLAFLYMEGAFPKNSVDHINHDRVDNRWANLRHATHKENSRNMRKRPCNTSGVTGVSWHSRDKKWQAQISVNKKKHVKYFNEFDDAVRARKDFDYKYGFHENHGR